MKKLIFAILFFTPLLLRAADYYVAPYPTGNNSTGNGAKDMKVAQATITYSQDGVADTIAMLPNLAIVWDIDIRVTTNFNDSGTDLLDIGTSASGATFLNDHDVSSGQGSFASITPSTPLMIWGNNYLTATYNGQNSNAGAGEVRIWIHYTLQ